MNPSKDKVIVQTLVSEEDRNRFKEAAEREGRSLAEWMRFYLMRASFGGPTGRAIE